jgi:hypothetical protein
VTAIIIDAIIVELFAFVAASVWVWTMRRRGMKQDEEALTDKIKKD